ncbi:MAG TPA: hypothetical protein VLG68_00955 [Gammaproteobacteria bacterium]|nr:hypothetical protein [Gammaproteobacteria bacterium]
MKSLLVTLVSLSLAACAGAISKFEDNPGEYGLYVAVTNIDMDTPIAVKNAATGEVVALKVRHMGNSPGYIMETLQPGRYEFQSYTPDAITDVPLTTANGYFEVQANCFNYGGQYAFGVDADGAPAYNDSLTLKDIERLPSSIREHAVGRDICAAGMGKPNERLPAADVQGQIAL